MTARLRSRADVVAALVLLLLTAGCASMPTSGPVVETHNAGNADVQNAMDIHPPRPQPGATPTEIVNGFLDAMLATPLRTSVAREYLSTAARDTWNPGQRTITYQGRSQPLGTGELTVTLTGAHLIDRRGAWLGPLPTSPTDLSFHVAPNEDGELRIDDPPNALIVPDSWYAERFQQVSLYFFDPTGRVLVPDPFFVERGPQLASALVSGLLQGPSDAMQGHLISAIPQGLRPGVSVPVSASGVASVDLKGSQRVLTDRQTEQLVSQLAWTLRQDPAVQRLTIDIGGAPVRLADGQEVFSVAAGDAYAPYVAGASTLLYGIEDGRLVGGSAQNLDPVTGPFGTADYHLRSVSLDLFAKRAAGVSAAGTTLYVGPVLDDGGRVTRPITGGTDLLDPAWDFSERLWVVDRTPSGAVVDTLGAGQSVPVPVDVPGVSGQRVKAFLVSRDGSRFIAVVHQADGIDHLVASRLLFDGQGRLLEATDAVDITDPDGAGQPIRDVAWQSPSAVVVLHVVQDRLFLVRTASVDGAPVGLGGLSLTLDGRIIGLAGTPVPQDSVYAVRPTSLVDLSGSAPGDLDVDPRVTDLGYVG